MLALMRFHGATLSRAASLLSGIVVERKGKQGETGEMKPVVFRRIKTRARARVSLGCPITRTEIVAGSLH
jgi:hypothetical protein